MIQITINEEILKRAKALGLNTENTGSAFIALFALESNNIHLLDVLDDHSKERRAFILYQTLQRIGFLEENQEGNTYYKLTEAGQDFVDSLKVKPEFLVQGPSQDKNDVKYWIKDWVDLFPIGVKTGGKLLRSDRQSCLIKMVQFLKQYPKFDKETIFKATEKYLKEREENDYAYTRAAVYFINKKGEGSDLASICELIQLEKDIPEEKVKTGMI